MDIIIIAYDLIEIRFYHDYTQYCAERSNELVHHIRPPAEVLQFILMLCISAGLTPAHEEVDLQQHASTWAFSEWLS
jgi:hypothetical protein